MDGWMMGIVGELKNDDEKGIRNQQKQREQAH